MNAVLILVPSPAERHQRSLGGDAAGWFGPWFDMALVDLVRTLDGPGKIDVILVPWRSDTKALLAAAAADTSVDFDPEHPVDLDRQRSRLVAYFDTEKPADLDSDPFWRASHISLGREGVMSLAQAAKTYKPGFVVTIGDPSNPELVRSIVSENDARVMTFSSLAPVERLANTIGRGTSGITNLEIPFDDDSLVAGETSADLALERGAEKELEPFIPFGLLVQEAMGDWLSDEETSRD